MQPLINQDFELSTAVDTQLKVLKEYDASSTTALQELIEKDKVADKIMRALNK